MKARELIVILLLSSSIVSCSLLGNPSEKNKEFCCDVVRVLHTIHKSRTNDANDFYETVYALKQGVDDANLIMTPWVDDSNPVRKKALDYIKIGLGDLSTVVELLLNSSFPLNEKKGAEFRVKLDSGLEKLYRASLIAMHPETGLRVSKSKRAEITRFTKKVFEKEISEFSKKINAESDYRVSWEIFAAAVMAGEFPK